MRTVRHLDQKPADDIFVWPIYHSAHVLHGHAYTDVPIRSLHSKLAMRAITTLNNSRYSVSGPCQEPVEVRVTQVCQ